MPSAGAVAFSSLLIGLLAGVHPVAVDVAASAHAASVEFVVDGREVARVPEPPWSMSIDFGVELRPHNVLAIARDADGREVGRARREVNVSQPSARLDIVLDRDRSGRPVSARLVATSVVRERSTRESLTLDGVPLVLTEHRALLPVLDLEQPHVLSGEAEFAGSAVARADVAFGGGAADIAESRLSAIPIRLTGRDTPSPAAIGRQLRQADEMLVPVLVEKGIATMVFVRNPSSLEADRTLGRPSRAYPMKFDPADRLRYVWPIATVLPGGSSRTSLIESMPYFSGRDGSFFWLLTRVSRRDRSEPPYRFRDAVAVAGMEAAASGTRRAVVLIEGDEHRDVSQFSAAQVTGYLRALGVPFRVWRLSGPGVSDWNRESVEVEDISSVAGLQRAVSRLKADLDQQRVAWIRGERYLWSVSLDGAASGFQLLD